MDSNETNYVGEISTLTAVALGARSVNHPSTGQPTAPFVVAREDFKVQDLEKLLHRPVRRRGVENALNVPSFVAHVNRHKGPDTVIFCTPDLKVPRFKAIFNYHGEGEDGLPGWGDFAALYSCPQSVEWKRWLEANGRKMNQTDFATFIEDNLLDIAEPAGADMLEISRTLEAKKSVSFASSVRLNNGAAELLYEENIQGTAAKGKMQIPEQFALGIPVFVDGQAYKVFARLRYRIGNGGALQLWYDLVSPEKIFEDAFKQLIAEVAEGTGITPLSMTC